MSSPPRRVASFPESLLESFSRPDPYSNDSYFHDVIYESPDLSDSDGDCGDEDVGSRTVSTLNDELENAQFGHPLQRMPRVKSADHGLNYDSDSEVNLLLRTMTRSSSYPSRSQSVASFVRDDAVKFDRLIDLLLDQKADPFADQDTRNLVMFDSPADDTMYGESLPPLIVKRFERSSPELLLLLELNLPELREDPWNPATHILRAIEKEESVYLCMHRLSEYNRPPLVNVAHYIDFFRQVLEGLSFLHEQRIAGLNLVEPSSYMVDLSSAPPPPVPSSESGDEPVTPSPHFDRLSYPVRYYLVNFTEAARIPIESLFPSSSPATLSGEPQPRAAACPFKRDVQDCGTMFERLLEDVPPIATKFKSLTKAMSQGGFTADDARRLFEALCRSVDANVFEKAASPSPRPIKDLPEHAHPIVHSISNYEKPGRTQGNMLSR